MIAYNKTRNRFVANELQVAKNAWQRFRGLLGSRGLKEGEGFLIPACKGIHTFGMRFSIDVLYFDDQGRVLEALKGCRPNLAGPVNWKSKAVLELPEGAIEKSHTEIGDVLVLEDEPTNFLPDPVPSALPLPVVSF